MTTRKDFLKQATSLGLACCGLGALTFLEGCAAPPYIGFQQKKDEIVVSKAEMAENKIVFLNIPQIQAPIFLKNEGEGKYTAMLMLCTHKACTVKPAGSILVCPCHGSEFSQKGAVLKGPANEPLVQFDTREDEKNIYILIKVQG